MSEYLDAFKDGMDLVDAMDWANIIGGGEGIIPQGYSDLMDPIGLALDTVEFAEGAQKFEEAEEFHPMAWDGIHDMVSGGGGILAEAAGDTEVGKVLDSFNVGFGIGDKLAPIVYGEEGGSKYESVPEDGIFKPTTGNSVVDWMFGVGE